MNLTTIQPFGLRPTPLWPDPSDESSSGSSLLADAAHIWADEETAGTPSSWTDRGSVGGLLLTPNGTVDPDAVAGRWDSFALDLDGIDQYLSRPDEAALQIASGQSVTFNVWVYLTAGSGEIHYILTKGGEFTSGRWEYYLAVNGPSSSQTAVWRVMDGTAEIFAVTTSDPVPFDEWVMLTAYFDADTGEAGLAINGGTFVTTTSSTTGTLSTGVFRVGALRSTAELEQGTISELCRWNRLLTSDEIASLLTASIFDLTASIPGISDGEGTTTDGEGTLVDGESSTSYGVTDGDGDISDGEGRTTDGETI